MNTIEEMIEVVQIYIHHQKDKKVKINRPTNATEFILLNQAYEVAQSWLNVNLKQKT